MITFKQFLAEAGVGEKPKYEDLSVQEAIALLNKHCKGSLWMLEKNRPFWRGMPDRVKDFTVVDTAVTTRKSQKTSNFYTLIFDNHPEMKDYPKRSRSFMCTNDYDKAIKFGTTYAIIPFDNTKIGIVNEPDMWQIQIKLFNITHSILFFNNRFERLQLHQEAFNSFIDFDKKLKDQEPEAVKQFQREFDIEAPANFLEQIFDAYSPKRLGFSTCTGKTCIDVEEDSEVWVGGKIIIISQQMWPVIRESYDNI